MRLFKCPDCGDPLLIVLPGDEVDEQELHTKIQSHQQKKAALESMLEA